MGIKKFIIIIMILAVPVSVFITISPDILNISKDNGPKDLSVVYKGLDDEGGLRFEFNGNIFKGPVVSPEDVLKLPQLEEEFEVRVKPLRGGSCFMFFISEKGQSKNIYESDLDCFELYSE